MDVTIDEAFSWKEQTGFIGIEVFGRRGAHVNEKTYTKLKEQCDEVRPANPLSLVAPLNSFTVHIAADVPDDILRPCNCIERGS